VASLGRNAAFTRRSARRKRRQSYQDNWRHHTRGHCGSGCCRGPDFPHQTFVVNEQERGKRDVKRQILPARLMLHAARRLTQKSRERLQSWWPKRGGSENGRRSWTSGSRLRQSRMMSRSIHKMRILPRFPRSASTESDRWSSHGHAGFRTVYGSYNQSTQLSRQRLWSWPSADTQQNI
jgi:hypothetical protein